MQERLCRRFLHGQGQDDGDAVDAVDDGDGDKDY